MSNESMQEFWNGEGGHKWLRYQDILGSALNTFGQAAMKCGAIASGERILDLGCGHGDTSLELARLVGQQGFVHGVDISETLLKHALVRIDKGNIDNISFECVDVQSHQFIPMHFDAAFSRFGVMFFEDPIQAFRNINQALHPGGRIIFICWQPVIENQWVNLPLELALNHIPPPPAVDLDKPGPFSMGDPDRILSILTTSGFAEVSIDPFITTLELGHDIQEAVDFLTHIGPTSAAIADASPNISVTNRIRSELSRMLQDFQTNNGIALGAATWIVSARVDQKPN